MSDAAPHLEAASEPKGAAAPVAHVESHEDGAGRSKLVPIVLAILLALAVVLLTVQYQQGRALVGQVEALRGELATANASLDAHRQHLEHVRTRVGDVRAVITDLEARVADLDATASASPDSLR